jgi:hypothetical protein
MLAKSNPHRYNVRASGVWLRPVERTVRVREVPSSNLGTPTGVHMVSRLG